MQAIRPRHPISAILGSVLSQHVCHAEWLNLRPIPLTAAAANDVIVPFTQTRSTTIIVQ